MGKDNQRKRRQRQVLHWAQGGLCATCGLPMGWSGSGRSKSSPSYPTFDHVDPASLGGRRTVANGLLRHRVCNEMRGNRRPTGCDMIWFDQNLARLQSLEATQIWGEAVAKVLTADHDYQRAFLQPTEG